MPYDQHQRSGRPPNWRLLDAGGPRQPPSGAFLHRAPHGRAPDARRLARPLREKRHAAD